MTPEPQPISFPDEAFEKTLARISRVPSPRVETPTHIIHAEPRMSANKLGEYMVADEGRKQTLIKASKRGSKAATLHYGKMRGDFGDAFGSDGFTAEMLQDSASRYRTASKVAGTSDWNKADLTMSADALDKIAGVVDKMQITGARRISRPTEGWGGLMIEGVYVSINPDVVFSFQHRGVTKVGAIMLYTTKAEGRTLSRRLADKECAGDYVAAILLKLLEEKLKKEGVPHPQKCYVIDVFRGDVYTAPSRFATLFKHIVVACKGIASRWKGIDA